MLVRLVRATEDGCGLNSSPSRRRAFRRVLAAVGLALAGCRRPETADTARLSWTVSPDPPRVGPAVLALSLEDLQGRPVNGARWQVEGDMTHPGMRPIRAIVAPPAGGRYEARLHFTMAGDWVLLVRADWEVGRSLERSIPLRVAP